MNLYDLWNKELKFSLDGELFRQESELPELVADNSEFVYVDGEEGDHGVITYYCDRGLLVATRTIHGGDSEDIELTPHGKKLIIAFVMGALVGI